MTKLHISGLVPGAYVALFPADSVKYGHALKTIFSERVFWWTLSKEVDPGPALLRVRHFSYLPIETKVNIIGNEVLVPVILKRDPVISSIVEDDLPAPSEFCNAVLIWANQTYQEECSADGHSVIINNVGIISCGLNRIIVIVGNVSSYRQYHKQTGLLWEDPKLFEKIKSMLNA